MDLSERLAISYYKEIADINESHKVYLVQHQETKKIYVKKVLDVFNLDIYRRLSALSIQGVPQIIACCPVDNQLILIEEYVSGTSLEELLSAKKITCHDVLHYICDICTVLEHLHSLEPPIIHRDIKPSNIIITGYNRAVLLDFNAAKFFSEHTAEDTVLLGTKGYAAPEQYGFGSSTPRTDIFSLGVVLKEMLAVCPDYPSALNKITAKCTNLNPKERYNNVTALKREISRLLEKPEQPDLKDPYRFLPPGFRTRTPWKMFTAALMYVFIFWLGFNLEVKNAYGLGLWIERITFICTMLAIVIGSCNYLGIQSLMPLCNFKSKAVRIIGVVILDLAMAFGLIFLLILVKASFFS